MQILITQIAYFSPYKRMLDFQKDGGVTFDPNRFESIETNEMLESNIPNYNIPGKSIKSYNIEFIKEQINEINYFHRRFTFELKDAEEMIIKSMILANNITEDYNKTRLKNYIASLITYLDKHYELAITLGLEIKKYDFILEKSNTKLIYWLSILLSLNYLTGIILTPAEKGYEIHCSTL